MVFLWRVKLPIFVAQNYVTRIQPIGRLTPVLDKIFSAFSLNRAKSDSKNTLLYTKSLFILPTHLHLVPASLAQTLTNDGATRYIAGTVQNSASGTLSSAGTLQVTGNLINAGTLASTGYTALQ